MALWSCKPLLPLHSWHRTGLNNSWHQHWCYGWRPIQSFGCKLWLCTLWFSPWWWKCSPPAVGEMFKVNHWVWHLIFAFVEGKETTESTHCKNSVHIISVQLLFSCKLKLWRLQSGFTYLSLCDIKWVCVYMWRRVGMCESVWGCHTSEVVKSWTFSLCCGEGRSENVTMATTPHNDTEAVWERGEGAHGDYKPLNSWNHTAVSHRCSQSTDELSQRKKQTTCCLIKLTFQ